MSKFIKPKYLYNIDLFAKNRFVGTFYVEADNSAEAHTVAMSSLRIKVNRGKLYEQRIIK